MARVFGASGKAKVSPSFPRPRPKACGGETSERPSEAAELVADASRHGIHVGGSVRPDGGAAAAGGRGAVEADIVVVEVDTEDPVGGDEVVDAAADRPPVLPCARGRGRTIQRVGALGAEVGSRPATLRVDQPVVGGVADLAGNGRDVVELEGLE